MDRKQEAQQLLASGQAQQAVPLLQAVVRENVNDGEAYALLGIAIAMSGRSLEALPHLERAVQLQPNQASHHYNLGSVYEQLGENIKALTSYQRALQLDPNYQRAAEALRRVAPAAAPPPTSTGPTPLGPPSSMVPPQPAGGDVMRPMAPPTPPSYGPGPGTPYSSPYAYSSPVRSSISTERPGIVTAVIVINILRVFLLIAGGLLYTLGGELLTSNTGSFGTGPVDPQFETTVNMITGYAMLIFALPYLWLAYAAYKGDSSAAWYTQLVFEILGLCGSCLVVGIIILIFWFKPETKAWYGVS